MLPELLQKLDRINQLIDKLQQTQNPLEFEAIDLPFKLSAASIQLWESVFSPETLQQLASSDPETLDAWAIALTQTLETQLTVLKQWLPILTTLPIPPLLSQKINDSIQSISQIASEKSRLLQTSANLFSQEEKLRHDRDELEHLQQKARELETIQTLLQNSNLDTLQQEIAERSAALGPEVETVQRLQQQQAELETKIAALKQQQEILNHKLTQLQAHQQRQETSIQNTTQQLVTLTQSQRENLSEATASVLADLEKQRTEYHQVWDQLQTAIQAFNQYQSETDEIKTNLKAYYHSNQDIVQRLPVDRQRVDTLIQAIQANLAELDQELVSARSRHEQAQLQNFLTFQS